MASTRRSHHGVERLEARKLMAADPIHVGVVYLETDYLETDQDVGGDSQGDRFILSFTGGAADTELAELRIRTDKDGDGISVGDPIYDTADGGRGKDGNHDFQIVRVVTSDGRQVDATAEVDDGGQELVLRLANFRAGDRLEFTLDVDEVLRNAVDLAVFNDRLDVITSGQEFQDSILEATFEAPHFEQTRTDAVFLNEYGDPSASLGLNLPPDESADIDSRPNRSAAAVGTVVQAAKPIAISGQVWVDSDLDLIREPGESLLPGVSVSLFRQNDNGSFVDTGFRATTDQNGLYEFPKSLGLLPGTYRVTEAQPVGFFNVGAVPGTIDGAPVGRVESADALSDIVIERGDTEAVDYDFAEAQPASVSGFVFVDHDNDGVRESGEEGIAGVRVHLVPINTISPGGSLTVTTAADGSYSFTGLAPGTYEIIEVDQPPLLNDGIDSAGTVDGVVVGQAINPGDRITGVRLLGADEGVEYNFGEVPFGSISGFVYLAAPGSDCDGNHDGPGNQPLAGVQVVLQDDFGQTVARVSTGADGGYRFDDVPVGNYRILEFTPAGLIDGESHSGTIDNIQVGFGENGGLISQINMTPGGTGIEYNFCEGSPAQISGYVYQDDSNDGVRDAGEAPIPGTEINLIDSSGRVLATARTNQDGRYEFDGILPGQYGISQVQPSGFVDGIDTVGTVRGVPIGTNVANDLLSQIELKQGDSGVEYNFGELLTASLSGRVHVDIDEDCVLDPGEEVLSGVTIRLLDASGNEIARTVTDINGRYSFENLVPGDYTAVQDQPAGFFDGNATAGSAGGDVAANRISNVTLGSGENAVEYDFCERPPAEIVGSVFADRDGDCFFDSGEPGIGGVLIELFDGTGTLVGSTRTDTSGNYRFTGLRAGDYTVRETQPIGFIHGGQTAGSAGGDDSSVDLIARVPVGWGERLTDYNFCELEPASISGSVYVDGNGDCIRDADEDPLAGVIIELRDGAGAVIGSTTTDANGIYRFDELAPGEYQIFEYQPDGFFHGGQTVGTGLGSVLGTDLLGLSLSANQNLINYDFCELEPSSISGSVYVDDDGDCVRDPDEDPLAGVVIQLRDSTGRIIEQTVTDATGNYRFDGLEAGEYQIFELQPDGLFQGGQTVGTGDGFVLGEDLLGVRLLSGQDVVSYDFCEQQPSSISGRVWEETDNDQTFDPGEVPIPGVLIELIDDSGDVVDQTLTDSTGSYLFDSIEPGVYGIHEVQPDQFFHGGEVVGDLGGEIGDDDLLINIDLTNGRDGSGYDFPEIPPATISGFVFQDGDAIVTQQAPEATELRQFRDGVLTPDDTRLAGVTLELRNVLGQPFDASRTLPGTYSDGAVRVVTDSSGFYQFTGLRAGAYNVYQLQPEDFIDGLDTPGSTGGLAVNPADQVDDADRIIIQTLAASDATDPNDDAILIIQLDTGGQSLANNFSEIAIEDPEIPQTPEDPREQTQRVITPIETFDPRIRLVTFAQPENLPVKVYQTDLWEVSWHLSVINAGVGPDAAVSDGLIRGVSSQQNHQQQWDEEPRDVGRWHISNMQGEETNLGDDFKLGTEDGIALAGDFDGDGVDEPAIYYGGQWFVDLNGNGVWDKGDLWISLGTALDRPVVGDWDGDGKDDVGIFGRRWQRDELLIRRDPGLPDPENTRRRRVDSRKLAHQPDEVQQDRKRLMLRGDEGDLHADAVDHVFQYGEQVDTPMSGDWNGDGIDQIAVYRSGTWMLDSDADGRWTRADKKTQFGRRGDEPIVGDFNGDGLDEIGVVRGDQWIIDTDGDRRLTGNDLRVDVPRPSGDSQPIVGDFDGDGKDEPGYYDEAG